MVRFSPIEELGEPTKVSMYHSEDRLNQDWPRGIHGVAFCRLQF
jgi:hypothetical protein